MEDKNQDTIGMTELLDEIGSDLEELRKQGVVSQNVALWWSLEREKLSLRHSVVNCVVTSKPSRPPWKRRYRVPGRWLELSLGIACVALGALVLLR